MSVQKSLFAKSIQVLMVSGLVITGLVGFSSSAISKEIKNTQESINTPTSQNTTNTIQDATHPNWCPIYKVCN